MSAMQEERLTMPLAQHNETVQPELVDTVKLSDEYHAQPTRRSSVVIMMLVE
ncbi:hypothetical protein [Halodesulfovibrio marinisediminis]|uniref:hypothetical protein n=1 Tax=Halodesulfovibrio marinisediminis TaxID=458711 RepID=UPI001588225D|nr:hypothetical protein [Halodesulfovibrio marinisediminis]